jgi:hypothetical protein
LGDVRPLKVTQGALFHVLNLLYLFAAEGGLLDPAYES